MHEWEPWRDISPWENVLRIWGTIAQGAALRWWHNSLPPAYEVGWRSAAALVRVWREVRAEVGRPRCGGGERRHEILDRIGSSGITSCEPEPNRC
jgi:hypothetical protein